MVELTMMSRLLEALRNECRLVLVGDPKQLTSVGAGAVLSDLVAGYEGAADSPVRRSPGTSGAPRTSRRWRRRSARGDADHVLELLRAPSDQISFVEATSEAEAEAALRPDCLGAALAVLGAAQAEDPELALRALDQHRLLCAHREGPYGVRRWNRLVERWLAEQPDVDVSGRVVRRRPLLVTSNDYALDVYNGETGVVVRQGTRRRAFVSGSERLKDSRPAGSTPSRRCTP